MAEDEFHCFSHSKESFPCGTRLGTYENDKHTEYEE
jgi:hypothetical protein